MHAIVHLMKSEHRFKTAHCYCDVCSNNDVSCMRIVCTNNHSDETIVLYIYVNTFVTLSFEIFQAIVKNEVGRQFVEEPFQR